MFGLKSNPKFAQAKSVDHLNRADITVAYYTGGGEEGWVKERFPKAQLRGVAGSGGRSGRGSDGEARRCGADQSRTVGSDGPQAHPTRRVAEGQQLPEQHRDE